MTDINDQDNAIRQSHVRLDQIMITVNDYLRTINDLNSVSLKELRKHCETTLNLENNALSGHEYKQILLEAINAFNSNINNNNNFRGDVSIPDNNNNNNIIKKGRFSKTESDMILAICREYLNAHNLEPAAVLSNLKEYSETNPPRRDRDANSIWNLLWIKFPDRDKLVSTVKTLSTCVMKS